MIVVVDKQFSPALWLSLLTVKQIPSIQEFSVWLIDQVSIFAMRILVGCKRVIDYAVKVSFQGYFRRQNHQ